MFAAYVRISSASQKTDSQLQEIQRWVDGNGIENLEWFVDTGSGDDLDRPEFDRLQSAIFNGEVKTVIVWKLDRLSRNIRDGINTLADWCDRGLRVVSITQQIDFNSAVGKLLAAVLLGVAEMEQVTRRERQAAGISAAKAKGVYKGRKSGSTKSKPERAIELRYKGMTAAEIASALNVSERTIHRYWRTHGQSAR